MTNKKWGRIGDSPIIGAGTYADDATCGVSATGHGEYFIRLGIARDVAARMAYLGEGVEEAAETVIMTTLDQAGGTGGVIALDGRGRVAMPFNTEGMYRGTVTRSGRVTTMIYDDEDVETARRGATLDGPPSTGRPRRAARRGWRPVRLAPSPGERHALVPRMTLPYDAVAASHALAAADARLAETVARVGPPRIDAPARRDAAGARCAPSCPSSCRSGPRPPSTAACSTPSRPAARSTPTPSRPRPTARSVRAGLSRAKTAALRDLVGRQRAGTLPSRAELGSMSDGDVIAALTAVRGVGVWTAQMVLIFNLGRPDVWPAADLGVQEGYRLVAGLDGRPTARQLEAAGEPYAPWRSVAAWYLWRAVEQSRAGRRLGDGPRPGLVHLAQRLPHASTLARLDSPTRSPRPPWPRPPWPRRRTRS